VAANWRERLYSIGTLPEDTHEERVSKGTLLIIAMLMGSLAIIWSTTYYLLGQPVAAAIPGSYSFVSWLSIAFFAITRRYGFFRFSQTLLIMLLSFLLQYTLGGFAKGSAVALWAYLAVLGGLIFYGERQARWWYLGFWALLIVSGLVDSHAQKTYSGLDETATIIFFVGNIGGVSAGIFFVVRYYMIRSNNALAAARAERLAAEAARHAAEEARTAAEQARSTIAAQAEQLRELDKGKTLFFANISHELRTPLALLLGPLQSLLEESGGTLVDRDRRRLDLAARNGRRLLRQINLLLDFTKADAGRMELDLQPEDPVDVARLIVEETQPAARARNIALSLDAPGPVDFVEIDRERMDQVLLNLIGNAIKFTPAGGRIEVGVAARGEEVEFRVTDTGIGVPEAEIPHLFEAFRQARRDKSGEKSVAALYRQDHQGTGLGLALVKQIVDHHGGRIVVESKEHQGTTFRLLLSKVSKPGRMSGPPAPRTSQPIERRAKTDLADLIVDAKPEAKPSNGPQSKVAVRASAEKSRVLIVDDNPDVRTFLADLLQNEYELLEAVDGQEGVEKAISSRPDMIISDVMMPRKSGFELVEELKSRPDTAPIPIMLLTARGGAVAEGLRLGADEYLAKPFDPKELTARVFALLRMTRLERDLAKVNAHLAEELQAARRVQESLLPAGDLKAPGLDVAARLVTASQLGGDYYDFFPVIGQKEVGVLIGDVSGHGASSALVSALAKASFEENIRSNAQPGHVLEHVASTIFDLCKGTKHMTALYGLIDREQLRFRYSNAGHAFPCCYRPKDDTLIPLALPGAPMGFQRTVSYEEREHPLQQGDILVLYSDGIIEAQNGSKRGYGLRRLKESVKANANKEAAELVSALVQDAVDYSNKEPNDDMTALVVKVV
jgi:signal transduction histidine kinase/serine phosphatase RsbU (regulator of sigma subunit)